MIGAQRRNSYLETEQAYRRFAADHRMKPVVVKVDEGGGEALASETLVTLLTRHPRIDALCAPVDVFAVGAVTSARELGRRIPEDLKIVTRYDGIRARECNPPLTAVTLHLDQLGSSPRGQASVLRTASTGRDARKSVTGPAPELVIRSSSRPGVPAAIG